MRTAPCEGVRTCGSALLFRSACADAAGMATAAADALSGAGEGSAGVPSSVPGGRAAAVAAGGPGAPACSAVVAYEEPDRAASSAGALGHLLRECYPVLVSRAVPPAQPAAYARRGPLGCANEAHSHGHISKLWALCAEVSRCDHALHVQHRA